MNKGQFKKGQSASPSTQFKPGQHWRERKLYWDKSWLENEYVNKFRSAKDIANEFKITESGILFWLKKHKIPRRDVSEIRCRKYWGNSGKLNPMFGKTGNKNGNWKGGITAERQAFYSSLEWKDCIINVWKRDKYSCKMCGDKVGNGVKMFAIHHKVSFEVQELRCNIDNLVLLCRDCHHFVHSKRNVNNEFLITHEQFKQRFE